MFREKLVSDPDKRGYLYIRESIYQRDKRTLSKKPKKLGDGSGYKNRGKYSKKKDIYCGKIIEVEPINFISFKQYLEDKNLEFTEFKLKSNFDLLFDEFISYILYVYDIKKDDFYGGKKKVYTIADGFLSRDILIWFKKFELKSAFGNISDFKRFYNRCQDCGVFDKEIIDLLYLKLIPATDVEDIEQEIKKLDANREDKKIYKDFKGFMKTTGAKNL